MTNKTHTQLCNRIIDLQDEFDRQIACLYDDDKSMFIIQRGNIRLPFGKSIRHMYGGSKNPNLLNVNITEIQANRKDYVSVHVSHDGYSTIILVKQKPLFSNDDVTEAVRQELGEYLKVLKATVEQEAEELERTLNSYKHILNNIDNVNCNERN